MKLSADYADYADCLWNGNTVGKKNGISVGEEICVIGVICG